MKKILQATVLTASLLLTSLPAAALGLGQLQLKSKLNEPLLAEIPIISSDPGELERLKTQLASPETFLRVGLPLPDKLVSDLQFDLAYDSAGRPYIRVTSPGVVTIPMVTFLVEADWGDGRLVREYSVLVATPDAVAAAEQPTVDTPVVEAGNAINRLPDVAASTAPPSQAMPPPQAQASAQTAARQAAPPPPAAAAAGEAGQHVVSRGQTLSGIANALGATGQNSAAMMAALMRANPEAFINGNPNRLREGAVLAIPDSGAVAAAASDGSALALQRQIVGWRGGRRGRAMQAVDIAGAAALPEQTSSRTGGAANRRGARLEIMPAAAGATAASGTRSGSGGEGDAEMNQQLQEARETIATRDAEVAELRARVAELETLQEQQAKLIQMKDSELASVQQNVRQQSESAQQEGKNGWLLWALPLLLVLAVAAAIAAWWRRRSATGKRQAAERVEPMPSVAPHVDDDSSVLATPSPTRQHAPAFGEPSWVSETPGTEAGPVLDPYWPASAEDRRDAQAGDEVAADLPSVTETPLPLAAPIMPESANAAQSDAVPANTVYAIQPDSVPSARPVGHATDMAAPISSVVWGGSSAHSVTIEAMGMAADVSDFTRDERIDLAETYLDLGDEGTARMLLDQVMRESDPQNIALARAVLDRLS